MVGKTRREGKERRDENGVLTGVRGGIVGGLGER